MNQEQLLEEIANSIMPDASPSPVPMAGVPMQIVESVITQPEKPVKLSDDEISAILDQQISSAVDWVGSSIALEQAKAMEYYLGQPVGDLAPPDIEDRSEVVDTVVSDQIEWLMPQLMEIFFGSDEPVKFCARKPGDEAGAEQMTAVCNHVVRDLNPGFDICLDWFKSAALLKVGVVKTWWERETEVTRETYTGITDGQLAVISDDPEVSIAESTTYIDPNAERAAMEQYHAQLQAFEQFQAIPPEAQMQAMQPRGPNAPQPQPPQAPQPIDVESLPKLHDVTLVRSKKSGFPAFGTVMNENFIISRKSKRVGDGFCAERITKTVSQLRAEGYKNIDDLGSDPDADAVEMSALALARDSLQDTYVEWLDDGQGDPAQREIAMYECYLPIDCDGDGISEWRKITKSGNRILDNEIVDGAPYSTICPVPIPGLFYGRSLADLGMPVQRLKTGMLRSMVDNMNLQVNGRTGAINGKVNMDDLLTNRPGGIVRMDTREAVFPLQQGMADMAGANQLLQYVDTMSQERTGITKYSQGLDSDTLNHTATGIENITQRADLRVKLIARICAEGMKGLFRLIQKLLANYQDTNMVFQLQGNWVDVDPRVWKNQYSMRVNVGTGTGDTGRRVNQLTQMLTVQTQMAQSANPAIQSIATPENIYNTATELVKALQLGTPAQFFSKPVAPPPAPPQPDPQMALLQGQIEVEREKAQLERQTNAEKIQAQARADGQHEVLLDKRERDKAAQDLAWEREKFYAQLAVNREKAAFAAKVTDPSVELAMNNAIQQDQSQDEAATIDREFAAAQQALTQ